MLPSSLLPGSLESFIVELGEIWSDDRQEADTAYLALFHGRSIVFKRKCIPSAVAANNSKVLVHSVNHMGITIVFRRPSKHHLKLPFYSRLLAQTYVHSELLL